MMNRNSKAKNVPSQKYFLILPHISREVRGKRTCCVKIDVPLPFHFPSRLAVDVIVCSRQSELEGRVFVRRRRRRKKRIRRGADLMLCALGGRAGRFRCGALESPGE